MLRMKRLPLAILLLLTACSRKMEVMGVSRSYNESSHTAIITTPSGDTTTCEMDNWIAEGDDVTINPANGICHDTGNKYN